MAASLKIGDMEWLYPDLLSEEGLRFILRQRYIKHATLDLESLPKEELIELYNQYILPLPQRKYRNNRRGREQTRKQMIFDKKLKRKTDDDFDQSKAKQEKRDGPSSGLVNHFSSPGSVGSRLKPPPSAVNFEKKVVKLNSSKHGSSSAETDGVAIKTWNKKVDGPEVKKPGVSSAGDADKHSQSKKRSHTSVENEDNSKDLEKINHSPATKISKITWP